MGPLVTNSIVDIGAGFGKLRVLFQGFTDIIKSEE
jgi:hypothetical protein